MASLAANERRQATQEELLNSPFSIEARPRRAELLSRENG
jgi:hypothetical protein